MLRSVGRSLVTAPGPKQWSKHIYRLPFLECTSYHMKSDRGLAERLPVPGTLCTQLYILQAASALLGDLLSSQTQSGHDACSNWQASTGSNFPS